MNLFLELWRFSVSLLALCYARGYANKIHFQFIVSWKHHSLGVRWICTDEAIANGAPSHVEWICA